MIKETLNKHIALAKNGNKESLDFVLRNQHGNVKKIATYIYRRYHKNIYTFCDASDLVQEGTMGVLKAINKFDSNHKSKCSFNTFSTCYIKMTINNFLIKHFNDVSGSSQKDSKKNFLGSGKDNDKFWENVLEITASVKQQQTQRNHEQTLGGIRKVENSINLQAIINNSHLLTNKELEILKKLYFQDMDIKEIANEMNVTQQTIYNIKQNGLNKLRKVSKVE